MKTLFTLLVLMAGLTSANLADNAAADRGLYPALESFLKETTGEFKLIDNERKEALKLLAASIHESMGKHETVQLTFICTHNSRRSHMGQLFAQAAAAYYGVGPVNTFSGGTEATAFNKRAVMAVVGAGFVVESPEEETSNPHYKVMMGKNQPAMDAWSKKFDDAANPSKDFIAVMTCSQADEACPIVPGAFDRVSLPFEDPKVADGTPRELETYRARARQIAREMMFVMKQVKALR